MSKDKEERVFKRALITGASSGIGEALAYLFANKGISLILHGRQKEKLIEIQNNLKAKVEVEILIADLSEPLGRKLVLETIRSQDIDCLINNAGFGLYGKARDLSIDLQMNLFDVNARALLEFTLQFIHSRADAKKGGVVLNVSSGAAFQVFPNFAVYAATKAFVNHISESLDFEVKNLGIRVLAACPGRVATGFSKRASEGHSEAKGALVMTKEFAAEEIWNQIVECRRIYVFDWKYRLLTRISRFLPKSFIASVLERQVAKIKSHS